MAGNRVAGASLNIGETDMTVPVAGFYAALLAIVCVALMSMVGQYRGKLGVSLGDAGDREMIERNRRHLNFVENVPLALLLIALVEANGAGKLWVHLLGATLLVSRIVHPFGIDASNMVRPARFVGAAGTVLVTLAAAFTLIWQFMTR
jgi:hypothetical protein